LTLELGALRSAGLDSNVIAAELGEIFAGAHAGRSSDDQITVYAGVGLAFQDLVAAWQVYQAAVKHDVGATIDFLR